MHVDKQIMFIYAKLWLANRKKSIWEQKIYFILLMKEILSLLYWENTPWGYTVWLIPTEASVLHYAMKRLPTFMHLEEDVSCVYENTFLRWMNINYASYYILNKRNCVSHIDDRYGIIRNTLALHRPLIAQHLNYSKAHDRLLLAANDKRDRQYYITTAQLKKETLTCSQRQARQAVQYKYSTARDSDAFLQPTTSETDSTML